MTEERSSDGNETETEAAPKARPVIISYGGGVQSSALVVLAVQGIIKADCAAFSNVGDDSEHPATLTYVRDVMVPWAASHGFPVHELRRTKRDGSVETLWERLNKEGSRSLPIPIRMSNGAPGNRSCTIDYKIKVLTKYAKSLGASAASPASMLIGISTDEVERAHRGRNEPTVHREYPLLDLGLDRSACQALIARAGLPVPPKSSCFFCPFHRPSTWAEMRRDEPDLFERSQQLEDTLNERRVMLGKDAVWLTRFNKRLSDAIPEAQTPLFGEWDAHTGIGETGCDEGVCFV